MKEIKVLIADDNSDVVDGICGIIESQPDMKVVGVVGNGLEAITKSKMLGPDVVLLDATMPEMGGIEATPFIKKNSPGVIVFILSRHTGFVDQAIMAGADGCIMKAGGCARFLGLIREAISKRYAQCY